MVALIFSSPDIADDLSRYLHPRRDGGQQFEIAVKGARCANCLAKIETGVKAIAGVSEARLNLSTGKLTVNWGGNAVSPHAVLRRVRDLGYDAQPFEAEAVLDANAREGRLLLRCLAVSGFATVFIMGLTDSIWYGDDMAAETRRLFFWLAAAVAVPVTIYAGQPFFRSALAVLGRGRTNMDVPISLALVLSLGLSLFQAASGAPHTYFDAAVMLTFLLLVGRYLDFRLRDRAEGAARHLLALQSLLARRFKAGGALETVSARDLAPGDHVFIASGERVPVNGVIEEGDSEIDVSLVTGESLPHRLGRGARLEAGSIVIGSAVTLRVTARVENSLVADLARLLETGQQARSLYVSLADRAARAYVPFVTILSALVWLGWTLLGASAATAVTNAIAVLIITCPCALGLAVPAVQIAATGRLFRHGVFVKSGNALERLAEIDTAIFDKTGTLTLGAPVLANGADIPRDTLEHAARLARASHHPLARALAAAAGDGPVADEVQEIPGAGLECRKGTVARLGGAAFVGAAGGQGSEIWFRAGDAKPVRFAFHDQIRPETRATLAALASRGIAIEMLTGDRPEAAADLARAAGIAAWSAQVTPQAKAARLTELRAAGHRTLMVGDGINDAAALALAHVAIAPGSAADVSQLAADMVLRGSGLDGVVEALDVARRARRLAVENFAVAGLYNIAAIPLAALGLVTPLIAAAAMAASSLIVILNALRLAQGPRR
jgi:Cu2+-exporting ATPase